MIVNGKELKKQILSNFRSVAEFARIAEVDYSYLQSTLNGFNTVLVILNEQRGAR